jgi:hypothetical protein
MLFWYISSIQWGGRGGRCERRRQHGVWTNLNNSYRKRSRRRWFFLWRGKWKCRTDTGRCCFCQSYRPCWRFVKQCSTSYMLRWCHWCYQLGFWWFWRRRRQLECRRGRGWLQWRTRRNIFCQMRRGRGRLLRCHESDRWLLCDTVHVLGHSTSRHRPKHVLFRF